MSNRHIEDGMGFSGLVPTAAERKQDEYEKALWNKIREKERRVIELEADRDSLREALQRIVAEPYPVPKNDIAKQALEKTT